MQVRFGVDSMVTDLRDVLVQAPTTAFNAGFDDPANGYLHPVDANAASAEHAAFVEMLEGLGVTVHRLGADDTRHADLIYTYDPAFVTPRGAVLLRSGKPTRRGEERHLAGWFDDVGVPIVGAIEEPGTVDGGDVMWLRPDLVAVGRSLRTNQAGIDQLGNFLDTPAMVFDLPYDLGPEACLHLMSTISLVSDTLAVVDARRLPSGLHSLLGELGVEVLVVPEAEIESLGANVLAVRPNVAVITDGNPHTRHMLEEAGVEVHEFRGEEIARNGTGGPTCLTRPILRV